MGQSVGISGGIGLPADEEDDYCLQVGHIQSH